ncbi:hypothetical protein NLG97_g3233 [Lecanicillium saksenae]|uniref:Uncharacterized protein n=1 Tax=Lecanicillium saksenae TaxID=468837 RepID=A0ACC1R0F9_9HYPO|nr:hypothetical protein NLG97_g3233 [Lecanicillium saksenae]
MDSDSALKTSTLSFEKMEAKATTSARLTVADNYVIRLKERQADPDRVFYDGEDLQHLDSMLVTLSVSDKESPRCWTKAKKWRITMLLGAYTFFAPFASTIFAPSLKSVMADLGETNPVRGALQIGILLIAFALAPIFLAPLTERYGRRIVISAGNIVFILFCLGGGFAKSTAQLAVCRFFCGVGGSSSLSAYGGVLADLWSLKDRARASSAVGGILLLGPVFGPVCGGWISELISWRWTCWVPAIAAALLEVIASFAYSESHVPTLLRQKKRRLARKSRNECYYTVLELAIDDIAKTKSVTMLLETVSRPLMYLFLDPAAALLAVYYAFVFGILYLVIVTFQNVFGGLYGHSPGIVGVDFLSQGIGALIGMALSAWLLELVYEKQMAKQPAAYKAESRLICAFPGAFCVTAGLFLYGFSAGKTHFIVPMIGVSIFSIGQTNTYMAIQLYVIDSFDYPASALASLSILRCLFAGVFPLFGERLFDALGTDWGIGMLAFLTLGLGGPFLPLIYKFGPRLRSIGVKNRVKLLR